MEKDAARRVKRDEVINALKKAGLILKLYYTVDRDAIICKISASTLRLKYNVQFSRQNVD